MKKFLKNFCAMFLLTLVFFGGLSGLSLKADAADAPIYFISDANGRVLTTVSYRAEKKQVALPIAGTYLITSSEGKNIEIEINNNGWQNANRGLLKALGESCNIERACSVAVRVVGDVSTTSFFRITSVPPASPLVPVIPVRTISLKKNVGMVDIAKVTNTGTTNITLDKVGRYLIETSDKKDI
jgi:hypothetical protein